MAQKIKPIYIIIGIVVFLFLFKGQLGFLGALADLSNAEVKRTASDTSVKAGNTFVLTYSAQGTGTGSWGVNVDDQLSCTSGTITPNRVLLTWLSSSGNSKTATITSPNSAGTCNFVGTYDFGGQAVKNINGAAGSANSIIVCTDDCTTIGCTDSNTRYTCSNTDADVCLEKTNVDCSASQTCSAGNCEYDCSSLENDVFIKADLWFADPDSSTKRSAVNNAILLWSENC